MIVAIVTKVLAVKAQSKSNIPYTCDAMKGLSVSAKLKQSLLFVRHH